MHECAIGLLVCAYYVVPGGMQGPGPARAGRDSRQAIASQTDFTRSLVSARRRLVLSARASTRQHPARKARCTVFMILGLPLAATGTVALWHYGCMTLWHCGTVALWHCGTVALWHCGCMY